ncbi:MAG TPA: hypothetical protein VGU63_09650 [Candidatus Acidoferrales bacterium]|nr:hypothetical protein [Candidatus Acidoferrales bacterium]
MIIKTRNVKIMTRARPLQVICAVAFLAICGATMAANAPDVPSVDGGIGTCRADFTVKDGANKPIYNAQIEVLLRYGFMNMRKTDLQVGTNSDGKARFTGLPNFAKKPLEFHIKSGTVSKTITDDATSNCTATYNVVLTVH